MIKSMVLRGLLWIAALVLSLILLLRSASWWMAVIMIMLVLIPALTIAWNGFAVSQPEPKTLLPDSSRKGETARGRLRVSFSKRMPLGCIYACLRIRNDLTYENIEMKVPLVKDRDCFTGSFELMSRHAGRISCTVDHLILTDYFGIFPLRKAAEAEAHLTVMPETFPVEIDSTVFTAPRDGDDSRSDRKGNDMTEIFQLRDYQPGDNLHGIHWKLSGKLDKLIYREPAQYVSNTLLIYWDQVSGTAEQMDALAEAVFSVGQALTEAGIKFTVGHSEYSRTETQEITDLDGLIEHFTGLLRRAEPEIPDIKELTAFGKVLYFTAEQPGFEYDESLQVFLCGEPEALMGNEIVFIPENACEVLERIEVYEG